LALKKIRFEELTRDVESCQACGLCFGVKHRVMGEGALDSRVVFIGEAPGRGEDDTGRPFVGSAGKLLDRLLAKAQLNRVDVFITNVVRCRPPENRRPKRGEVEACSRQLMKLLEIIQPEVIAPMGNSAIEHIFEMFGLEDGVIGDVHGKTYRAWAPWGSITVYPLYHPAAAIYNRKLLNELEMDMGGLATLLG
jgi:uracil-DNA glycosylase family 4